MRILSKVRIKNHQLKGFDGMPKSPEQKLLEAIMHTEWTEEEHGDQQVYDAKLSALKLYAESYKLCLIPETFPFQVGQFVTPRANFTLNYAGHPHIVLEILPGATAITNDPSIEPNSNLYGRRRNMRVLTVVDGVYVPFWVEAFEFLPYEPHTTSIAN